MDQEAQQRIMGFYIEEARDHLLNLEQGLVSLRDRLDDSELINDLFRAAHSIKGGAAMLGLGSIQKTAHRLEDTFKVFREREVPVDDLLERLLLQAYDSLANLLDQLQTGSLTEASGEAVVQAAEPTFDQMEHHLQVLLGEATPAAAPVAAPASAPDFNQVVSQRLRDMLDIVKKGQPDARQNLQAILTTVAAVGSAYAPWQDLVATIQAALAVESNDLRMLALVFLRDLKAAQQFILEGQVAAVQPSADLLAKLPVAPHSEPTLAAAVALEPTPVLEPVFASEAAVDAGVIDDSRAEEEAVADVAMQSDDVMAVEADLWAGLPDVDPDEAALGDDLFAAGSDDPWADLAEPSVPVSHEAAAPVADEMSFWDAASSAGDVDANAREGELSGSADDDNVAGLGSTPLAELADDALTAELAADPWAEAMSDAVDPWDAWESDAQVDEPLSTSSADSPPATPFDADNPYDLKPLAADPWAAAMEEPAVAPSENVDPWHNLAAFGGAAPAVTPPSDPLEDWLATQDVATDPSADPFEDLANLETGLAADVAIANLEMLEPSGAAADSLADDSFSAWLSESEPVPSDTAVPATPPAAEPMFLDDLSTLFASDVSGLEAEWQAAPAEADDTELGDWMADLGVENDSAPRDPDTEAEMLASIFDTPPPSVAEPAPPEAEPG
ncbi:MAG: hypothetical protein HC910_23030 [Spirulinaceae cyanobacterium SM2_1_0]|nr:hypothetical protein [Spirulinaceae cyanobacterium SM2_1_0]